MRSLLFILICIMAVHRAEHIEVSDNDGRFIGLIIHGTPR
jgi:hypothetical protein